MKSEEEKKQDNIDLQQDAKNLVLQELEKNGVINYMRAKIKKSVLDIINKQKDSTKQKLEFDFMTPLHRLNKTKEILIACHLIKDFLKFYELDYTFPIFENESNVKENIKRETLFKECKLKENKEEPKPILLQLVIEQLERKETPIQNNSNSLNNGPQDRYNFSNFSSVYNNPNKTEEEIKNNYSNPIIPGKVQLTPISFTQKSVDINNDSSNKFNTLNISDVYKRDNNTNNNNNINNNNENKEITAQDILNKGRRKNNNDDINLNNNNNNNEENNIDPVLGTPMIKNLANMITNNTTVTKNVTITKDGKTVSETNTNFVIDKNTDNNEIDDDEFNDIIEDIDKDKGDGNDESKKSFGNSSNNVGSLGFDSSITNFNEKNFDYVEDVDKI